MFLTYMSNTYINRNHRFNMFIDTYGIHRFQIISKGRYSRCSKEGFKTRQIEPGKLADFSFYPKKAKIGSVFPLRFDAFSEAFEVTFRD